MFRLQGKKVWIGAACLLLAGCGGKRLVPVEGTVTINGEPMAGISVYFISTEPPAPAAVPLQGYGFTDDDGHFKLITERDDGLFPGSYKVCISKTVSQLPKGVNAEDVVEVQKAISVTQKWELMPPSYTQMDKTPLQIQVPEGGKRDIEIDVKSPAAGQVSP